MCARCLLCQYLHHILENGRRMRHECRPKEMQKYYRYVFSTPEGKIVLGDLLALCHFGVTLRPDDAVQVAEYNVGLTIARMAGALDFLYRSSLGIPDKEDKSNGTTPRLRTTICQVARI